MEYIIKNCDFEFLCTKSWEELDDTADVNVKHCKHCKSEVHFCAELKQLNDAISAGLCVAVDKTEERKSVRQLGYPSGARLHSFLEDES